MICFQGGDTFTVAELKKWLEQFSDDQILELSGDYMESGYLTTYERLEPSESVSKNMGLLGELAKDIYENALRAELAISPKIRNAHQVGGNVTRPFKKAE